MLDYKAEASLHGLHALLLRGQEVRARPSLASIAEQRWNCSQLEADCKQPICCAQ